MEEIAKNIVYFASCGEINTQSVLMLAREYAKQLGIRKVILASETGRSALRALEIFQGTSVNIIVITHFPAFTDGPKGKIPIGLKRPEYAERMATLIERGVKIIQAVYPLPRPRAIFSGMFQHLKAYWIRPLSYLAQVPRLPSRPQSWLQMLAMWMMEKRSSPVRVPTKDLILPW